MISKFLKSFEKIMEKAETEGVQVIAESFYLESESNPDEGIYIFAYRIKIKNFGQRTVKLLRRHWIISDSNGDVNHVRGDGVVGEQPVLESGDEYEYTSGSRLKSVMGTMEGSYVMTNSEGYEFEVMIPCFTLSVPGVIN